MLMKRELKGDYSPLYFLASLGAGGLGVSVYMYLMFMIKHPKVPLATFEFIYPVLSEGSIYSILVGIAILGILIFSFFHFKLLIWNIKEYKLFKKTKAFEDLKNSSAEVSLMAIPLTLAMTINVCFVLGAAFVPNLWSVVEYMFPAAIMGFLIVGIYGLKIYGDFLSRVILKGGFEFEKNSNFSQMIAAFAFSMVSVGLAAPGAMSHHIGVSATALFCSIFFMIITILVVLKTMFLGFKSMYIYGISKEAAGSLWILIPIATLIGITLVRISFGLVHNFDDKVSFSYLFMLTTAVVSLQISVGLLGYKVMKTVGYFKEYVNSDKKSASALGLVCPGVAFFVFGMFFIFFGLVKNEVIEIFSLGYFLVLLPFVMVQLKTIQVYIKLYKKLFF